MNLSDSIKNLKNKIEDINNKVKNLIKLSNLANAKAKDNETKVENAINTAYNNLKNINEINNKIEALKYTQSLAYEGAVVTCENTLASRTFDMLIKGNTHQNASKIESAGENEGKIIITSNNNKPEDDIDYKEYKKEILLPIDGGLKLIHNGVYDTIEQRTDGVYLVQKIGKYDIKESDEIKIDSSPNQNNTIAFLINVNANNIKTSGNNNICNNFNRFTSGDVYWNSDIEGVLNSKNSQFKFRILKSKLSTQDIAGIKAWLKANPTTVYYELSTPIETKLNINNLDLEVYKDTTYVTTDNAIKPALSFKVPTNIGGVMQTNAQNVNKLYKLVDDTQANADIAENKQDKTDNALDTTDKTVVGAINEVNGNTLDNVTFSADYKNIIINRKNGQNPYTIPISAIIHNAKLTELNDVDSTNIGDGKTLVYDGATKKHKYVSSTGTDELVKMNSTTDPKYLSELIDKSTIVNDNGVLKVKKLDGQEVTIAEINHLKGLTMNVMDLVNSFANGGVKVYEHTIPTYADLSTLDRSTFIDGIKYFVYVQSDETHGGAKTTYICDKSSTSYFCVSGDHRDFTTSPIDLANEVTGKLGTANIDVDALWKLLTINDTYKTLTTKNEQFGTHGAKALYDELVAEMGNKANATDLTTHTSDTNIHITSAERTAWNKKANATDLTTHTSDTNIHITSAERTAWNKKANATDLTTHTGDTNIHVTNADKTKWNEVDNKVNKTDITTTIDSSSTDSQVPSAKVVYDNIINKLDNTIVLTTADKANSFDRRYQSFIIHAPVANAIGLPGLPSSTWFCIHYSHSKGYKFPSQIAFEYAGLERIMYRTSINGVWCKWKKLCTTSVADVPKTKITLNSGFTGVAVNYEVKNGVCYVNIDAIKSEKTGQDLIVSDTLFPKPSIGVVTSTINVDRTDTKTGMVYIDTNSDNKLKMHCYKANTDGWCTFSYPVAES